MTDPALSAEYGRSNNDPVRTAMPGKKHPPPCSFGLDSPCTCDPVTADFMRIRTLEAHLADAEQQVRLRNLDSYECRQDIEALIEVLVEKCQMATDENVELRMVLLELRNVLANRLPFDDALAQRLFTDHNDGDPHG